MPITAGSITITRRINTGDYSHKEAKAEVHYTVEGTDDPGILMDAVRHQAVNQLAQALATVVTIKHTPEVIIDGSEQTEAPINPLTKVADKIEEAAAAKRHRRTKAEMTAGQLDYLYRDAPAAVANGADDGVAPIPQAQLADDPPEDWGPAVAEISDKELNAACNETNNRIKNKAAIQGIIQHYTDGAVASIPQAQRAQFLTELQTL
jgi:hypothetical protein